MQEKSNKRPYNMDEEYTCSREGHSCGKEMRRGSYTEECYELKQCPQCYTVAMTEKTPNTTEEEHLERHKLLHRHLDELLADWITCTGKRPSQGTVLELIHWSSSQIAKPTNVTNHT